MGHEIGAMTTIQGMMIAGFEALDLLNVGVVITTDAGRVVLANSVAEEILQAGDGLELSSSGELRSSRRCCPALIDTLKNAGKNLEKDSAVEPSVLVVRRPSGKKSMTLVVRYGDFGGLAKQQNVDGAAIVILILDPEFRAEAGESDLRELYALTATEARLSGLLINGKTLEDCCEEMGVSRLTLYSHLKRLFKKVGVQSQSELVSVLLKGVGVVSKMTVAKRRGSVWSRYC